jgi:hypothetical protein
MTDGWLTYAGALIVGILFIVVCVYVPTRWTKRFRITDPDKKAEVEDSYRKTIAQVLGGAAIALAFAWTWVKDHETLEQTRIQSSNQQFGEAAKLIATESVDARAAGAYSMESLVVARPPYYAPAVNTLKSVVKTHRPRPPAEGEEQPRVTADIQAVIYVLGRLPGGRRLEMTDLYLAGGNFSGLSGFRDADFRGAALFATNFSGADLTGAVFDGSQMSDWESVGSKRWSYELYQQWKKDKAWERARYVAWFDYANLTNTSFKNMSVAGASFQHAHLAGAKFDHVDVSRADFQYAIDLERAVFIEPCYGMQGEPLGLPPSIKLLSPCP